MQVGIREFKARLSEFLDLVERGEVITVTDRGRPKARVTAVAEETPEETLARGRREGWIRPAAGRHPTRWETFPARRRVEEILAEDRGP